MKIRIDGLVSVVLGFIVVLWATYAGWAWYTSAIALSGFGLYGLLTIYETRASDPKYIACIATLSAIAAVSRTAVQGVPGVQPATFFVILSGFSFGPFAGTAVGVFTAVGSDLFLGEGGWTPWQMLAWGLAGMFSGLLRQWKPSLPVRWLAPYGFVWGFLFGWIMNTWTFLSGFGSSGMSAFFILCLQSFWFDLSHATTTGVLLAVVGGTVFRILERFRRRLTIVRES